MKKEQIAEWTENPVTLHVLDLAQKEYEAIQSTANTDCLVAGEPIKTHENLVELEARERSWELFIELLEGELEYFDDE